MEIPDVVGLQLGDARQILDDNGIVIQSITVTSPPREKTDVYDQSYRVVRTSVIDDNMIHLLVCKPL